MKIKGWRKALAITAGVLGGIVGLVAVAFCGYLTYLEIQYYRIEDGKSIEVQNPQPLVLQTGKTYSVVTHNIGFGAYEKGYSFFLDSETTLDGKKLTGVHGRALSKESVIRNTEGALSVVQPLQPDFLMIQEADWKGTRSYGVNQVERYQQAFPDYAHLWAVNFHSAYLPLPITEMHGSNVAGLLLFSKYRVARAVRHQYPVSKKTIPKFTDLDRCFLSASVPLTNGKELVLVNSHMSAYDKGGTIRSAQLKVLNDFMAGEYAKGNYVIVGGDFNHALGGELDVFPSQRKTPTWIFSIRDEDLAEHFRVVIADNSRVVSTCRSCDAPYEKGVSYEAVLDGFLVSDNVVAHSVNVDAGYLYSDHNPVQMTFTLR